ncbi:unnamed protein product [Pleuronectes platessa]|uniref:Uncharacterized protein n=1 Tax=Pleuronectes platessa TaxID=8262 RepID=A0A9N7YVR9_PLEPL|nr:unnamed protein product [Pleuronectes platessa]
MTTCATRDGPGRETLEPPRPDRGLSHISTRIMLLWHQTHDEGIPSVHQTAGRSGSEAARDRRLISECVTQEHDGGSGATSGQVGSEPVSAATFKEASSVQTISNGYIIHHGPARSDFTQNRPA